MSKSIVMTAIALAAVFGMAPRPAQAQQRTITCESIRNRREICRVDTSGGVRLVERLSDRRCVEGRTWGYTRGAVWVDDGCRARFRVNENTRYGRGEYGRGEYGRGGHGQDGYGRNGDWNNGYGARSGEQLCEARVADRLNVRRSRIDAWPSNGSRNNALYRWRGAGREGTCRIDRNGHVDVDVRH
jgi:DUF3011 family protein